MNSYTIFDKARLSLKKTVERMFSDDPFVLRLFYRQTYMFFSFEAFPLISTESVNECDNITKIDINVLKNAQNPNSKWKKKENASILVRYRT